MTYKSVNNTPIGTVRRYAFYASVVLAIAVPVALIQNAMLYLVTGWTGFLGSHSVHNLVIFAVVWMGLLGLAVQFYRPASGCPQSSRCRPS